VLLHCTYRIQLHRRFTFDDAASVAGYLARLGVSHLYCSPYLQADEGSTHGYDVVDHSRLNDELGGAAAHARLVDVLESEELGQVLDVVPNHMARDGRANRWWWDVLENGPSSRYAAYFEIDWHGDEEKSEQTVLVPVLADHYGRVLEAGDLRVVRDGGSFVVRYHEHELPLSPRTLDDLVAAAAKRAGSGELAEIADAFGRLPHARVTEAEAVAARHRDKEMLRERLARLCDGEEGLAAVVDAEVEDLNATVDALDTLLRRQNFRLALWRTASEELDYRRFFNIDTLIGLRVEDDAVFADTHAMVLDLVRRGAVDGLRIDHVDGLRDPEGYLHRLRRASGGAYTVVEKILEPDEELPGSWPVEGTSGYDFITRVNNLFVDCDHEAPLTSCYERFTGESMTYEEVVYAAKHQIMREELAAEIERLTRLLAEVCDGHRRYRDHTRRDLREAVREVVAAFRCLPDLCSARPGDRRRRSPAHRRGGRGGPPAPTGRRRRTARPPGRAAPARVPRRDGDGVRPPLRPGERPGHGQGRRRHRLLPLPPADLPQRGGRRPGRLRPSRRRLPCRRRPDGDAVAGDHADAVHPRDQAQRRRPGPPASPL
jgi:(1->4)-alpha-D-glucan 1-alpha-D-glucosylmutase